MKVLGISAFPGCCGISIVSGFPYSNAYKDNMKFWADVKTNVEQDLDKGIKDRIGVSQGIWMIVLATYQKEDWHDELIKRGWTPVVKGALSKMHGNKLYTYVKVLHPDNSDSDVLGDV